MNEYTLNRPPNELWISVELAQQVFVKGYRIDKIIEFTNGPAPDARIRGCYYNPRADMLAIVYDRPVPEVSITERREVPA